MYQEQPQPVDNLLPAQDQAAQQATFMTKVYGWMTLALTVTGLVAFYTASSPQLVESIFSSSFTFFALIIGTFLLVGWLSLAIRKMSPTLATLVFLAYSALNGLIFSSIFLVYDLGSIALTFFITAGTFGAMSVYGYVTNADLSRIGNVAFMGLIGVIIASVVNMFMQNETLYWLISYVGVAVFVALVAYDTQKIKTIGASGFEGDGLVAERKASIIGALTLYLDFINLFLFLLRLFGGRRD